MNKDILGVDEAARVMAQRRMRDEVRVLAELDHPHLVRMVEVCESPQHLFIVMERAAGRTLALALSLALSRSARRGARCSSASCRAAPSARGTRST